MAGKARWYLRTVSCSRSGGTRLGEETQGHGANFRGAHLGVYGALSRDSRWCVVHGLERGDASKRGGIRAERVDGWAEVSR